MGGHQQLYNNNRWRKKRISGKHSLDVSTFIDDHKNLDMNIFDLKHFLPLKYIYSRRWSLKNEFFQHLKLLSLIKSWLRMWSWKHINFVSVIIELSPTWFGTFKLTKKRRWLCWKHNVKPFITSKYFNLLRIKRISEFEIFFE